MERFPVLWPGRWRWWLCRAVSGPAPAGCLMLYSSGDSDGRSGWQLLFPCVMLLKGGV